MIGIRDTYQRLELGFSIKHLISGEVSGTDVKELGMWSVSGPESGDQNRRSASGLCIRHQKQQSVSQYQVIIWGQYQ